MNKQAGKTSASTTGEKSGEKIPRKSTKGGKTAKQIMRRHITDKNDVITEEEFKELNVEIEMSKEMEQDELIISDKKGRPKDEDKDPKTITPWDVISE